MVSITPTRPTLREPTGRKRLREPTGRKRLGEGFSLRFGEHEAGRESESERDLTDVRGSPVASPLAEA